eukprot:scaffold2314_cov267-Pinguiococcus_pyrenoidosus.AAC.2
MKKADERRSMGALCACTAANMRDFLPRCLEGEHGPEERSRLQAIIRGAFTEVKLRPALNDLLFSHPVPAAVSRFRLKFEARGGAESPDENESEDAPTHSNGTSFTPHELQLGAKVRTDAAGSTDAVRPLRLLRANAHLSTSPGSDTKRGGRAPPGQGCLDAVSDQGAAHRRQHRTPSIHESRGSQLGLRTHSPLEQSGRADFCRWAACGASPAAGRRGRRFDRRTKAAARSACASCRERPGTSSAGGRSGNSMSIELPQGLVVVVEQLRERFLVPPERQDHAFHVQSEKAPRHLLQPNDGKVRRQLLLLRFQGRARCGHGNQRDVHELVRERRTRAVGRSRGHDISPLVDEVRMPWMLVEDALRLPLAENSAKVAFLCFVPLALRHSRSVQLLQRRDPGDDQRPRLGLSKRLDQRNRLEPQTSQRGEETQAINRRPRADRRARETQGDEPAPTSDRLLAGRPGRMRVHVLHLIPVQGQDLQGRQSGKACDGLPGRDAAVTEVKHLDAVHPAHDRAFRYVR